MLYLNGIWLVRDAVDVAIAHYCRYYFTSVCIFLIQFGFFFAHFWARIPYYAHTQHLTPNDMCEFNYMRYVFVSLLSTLCYSLRCLVICWLFVWSLEFRFAPFRSAQRKISQSYNIQNHQNSQTTRNNKPFYSNSRWNFGCNVLFVSVVFLRLFQIRRDACVVYCLSILLRKTPK